MKTFISLVMAGLLLCTNGYAMVEYHVEEFGQLTEVFQSVFQYEKTNDGYIVCTPAYRMAMQNYMWNGEGKTVYLYDDSLNLIKQADFSGDVR